MIVAVTGHVEEAYVVKAYDNGMDRVFSKPFPIKEFAILLKSLGYIKDVPDQTS